MKFNTVAAWLEWQAGLHGQAIELGLDRIRPVFLRLVTQSLAKKTVVIGGTNGKGSTVAFFEAIYIAAGYQVGSYTSPHLLVYNERIRLQGELVSDEQLCQAFERVEQARENIPLTYFEFGTLAAFELFQKTNLDIVFLEIGLGGRLDVVNLADADVSLITNVELDHMDWLGDTREQIAMEKFGIARTDKPLVYVDEDLPENALECSEKNKVQLYQLGKDYFFQQSGAVWEWSSADKQYHSLPLPSLAGLHQVKNAAGVLMAVTLLQNELPLSMAHLRVGLTAATLPGRFQVTAFENNLQIVDVAHNPHGIKAFLNNLVSMPKIGDHFLVFGMLQDKAIVEVIALLKPHIDHWFVASIHEPRGLSAEVLTSTLIAQSVPEAQISQFETPVLAYESARSTLQNHDKLLALGSFYVVADVLSYR